MDKTEVISGSPYSQIAYETTQSPQWGDLKILSGTANPELANKVAAAIGIGLTEMEVTRFADGEINVKIKESMRGHDVFLVQPTCHPVNENLIELFIILDALRRASAARITAVVPYYAYARKEKKTQPREPISAKLMANIITLAGAHRIIALDLHTEAIEGFFDVPVDHLTAIKILAGHVKRLGLQNIVVVSPDVGGTRRARRLANILEAPLAIVDKRRPADDVMEVMHVVGDVEGQHAIVIDDMITTGMTVASVAKALLANGALSVRVLATHPVMVNGAIELLRSAPIEEIVVTDTIPLTEEQKKPPVTVLSVAPLIAEAIMRIHSNGSVSELFH